MSPSGFRRFRDVVAMGGFAGLLALAFTTALSGGQDPDYAMHPLDLEVPRQLAADLDCDQLRFALDLSDEPLSSADVMYRRDLRRAHSLLVCGD